MVSLNYYGSNKPHFPVEAHQWGRKSGFNGSNGSIFPFDGKKM